MNKGPFQILVIFSLLLFASCGQELALKEAAQTSSLQNSESNSDSESERETKACPSVYEPVCAQPPMPECPSGNFCAQVMPSPKTYSNECERVQAEATFISHGPCEASSF